MNQFPMRRLLRLMKTTRVIHQLSIHYTVITSKDRGRDNPIDAFKFVNPLYHVLDSDLAKNRNAMHQLSMCHPGTVHRFSMHHLFDFKTRIETRGHELGIGK